MTMATMETRNTVVVCQLADLIPNSGVAVKIEQLQLAIFYLPAEEPSLYVLDNYDPLGQANVLSRGIVGDRAGALVVASPLYKQHFDLLTGYCQEDSNVSVGTYPAKLIGDEVVVSL